MPAWSLLLFVRNFLSQNVIKYMFFLPGLGAYVCSRVSCRAPAGQTIVFLDLKNVASFSIDHNKKNQSLRLLAEPSVHL